MFGIDAVNADEHNIGKEHVGGGGCEWTHESEPSSAEEPSRNYHFDVLPVTQFHCHIYCVGNDGYAAEHLKASNNFGRCGTTGQCDCLTRADEFCRSQRDAALFFSKAAHLVLE